jgi:branched-chain amino acid transport system ATP-binding protein
MNPTTDRPAAGGETTAATGMLELRHLSVPRGGRDVVHGVDIEIPAGEVTALLGANGAGKSSMVLAIGGAIKPSGGEILLDGKNIAGRRPEKIRQAGVAVVPEGRRLLGDLTVEDNLKVACYSLPKQEAADGWEWIGQMFPELQRLMSAQARALSGGEQQMLVLAQALITHPRFICIDELSLGLAPVVLQRLIPVIRNISAAGTGVLLIEQFATIALSLANRAHVIEQGRLQYSGTAAELREHPEKLESAYLLRGQAQEQEAAAIQQSTA